MRMRTTTHQRNTNETKISVRLCLDGNGSAEINTGIGFLDHMLCAVARHAQWNIVVQCKGDINVDDHHTSEDVALALGVAFDQALGERRGITRFGVGFAPLDEALARVVVDISSRPFACVSLNLVRPQIGAWACENIEHFFISFSAASRLTLHVDVLKGRNDHHKTEAAFKAFALAIRQACTRNDSETIPSTKGVLS